MKFPEFLGNEETKAALAAAFSAGRFPHAIILQGEEGCGKRTLARLIAKALVCRDRDNAPCGVCPSCVRAAAGSHPDIRVVEGSGATRSLSVDTVKAVIADAYRMPEESAFNVYLLLLGARTSDAAQNKLLKVIEEPPEGAVFLLVCENAEQLLPTIRSRAQCFTLKPPPLEEAAAFVQERAGIDAALAQRLAALCGGNIGRMLSEHENGDAARAAGTAGEIATAMLAPGGDGLFKAAAPLQKDRKLCAETLTRLELIFRDACVLRAGGTSLLSGAGRAADALSALPKAKLYALPELMIAFREKLERNANLPLLVTCLCLKLRESAGR